MRYTETLRILTNPATGGDFIPPSAKTSSKSLPCFAYACGSQLSECSRLPPATLGPISPDFLANRSKFDANPGLFTASSQERLALSGEGVTILALVSFCH